MARTSLGEFVRSQTCARCGGAGRIIEHPCARAKAPAACSRSGALEIEIPAGIHDGQRIRLSGEGHAGPVGGQAGDLYVLVRIRPHERLVREGDDIFSTVDLTMTQAALGAKVEVGTLDGEVELEFEPGTQPGELRVLRGRGMPVLQGFGRGDQRVLVNVACPASSTRSSATCSASSSASRRRRPTAPTRASSRS